VQRVEGMKDIEKENKRKPIENMQHVEKIEVIEKRPSTKYKSAYSKRSSKELTFIMRQREYFATASSLNDMAKGKRLADVKLIMSRGVTQSNLSPKTTRRTHHTKLKQ